MRVLATTTHRIADSGKTHGFLVEIDWATKEILRLIEAPPLYSHLGQRNRGGRRGLRGITRFADRIWFASCDALYGLLPDTLELDRVLSHRWMAHIHEIEAAAEGIWITSTGGNGVFLVGLDQQAIRAAWLNGEPDVDLRIHLERKRDVFHVNTVYEADGKVYAYALTTGQVFQMLPGPVTEVAQLEQKCHNVLWTEYGWFRNDSMNSRVLLGERSLDLPRRGLAGQYTQPGWLRGMARLSNGNFLVGSSPASIYEVEPRALKVVDEFLLTDDVCWTIHGIYADEGQPILRPSEGELRQTTRRLKQLTAYSPAREIVKTIARRAVYNARRAAKAVLRRGAR